jgi:hypothetical protein
MTHQELIKVRASRPLSITVIAFVMILFGLTEIVTGFTHT